MIKKLLLKPILLFARLSTPSQGPSLIKTRDDRTSADGKDHWWGPVDQIDTGHGFSVDKTSFIGKIILWVLKTLPIWDESPDLDPNDTAQHVNNKYGDRIPEESTQPRCLHEFLTQMTGSYFLQSTDDPEIMLVDLSDYEDYEVRDGFERYGGQVYLNNDKIIRYHYRGEDYSGNDQRIELIVRATLCLKMMVELHALRLHLCTSQKQTFIYRDNIPESNRWIDLLYLSTFGQFEVNRRIPSLVGPGGFVSRLFALTPESYQQYLENVLAQSEFTRSEYLGLEGTEWYSEISKYMNHVDQLIGELDAAQMSINLNDSDDEALLESTDEEINLTELADFLVSVTALHNQFGDAQMYSMAVSAFFLPKVYLSNPGFISKLDRDLLTTLLISVSPRFPLLREPGIEKVFLSGDHQRAWKDFIDRILEDHKTIWFDPNFFETSIGF